MQSSKFGSWPAEWVLRPRVGLIVAAVLLTVVSALLLLAGIGMSSSQSSAGKSGYFLIAGLFIGGVALSTALINFGSRRPRSASVTVASMPRSGEAGLKIAYRAAAYIGYVLFPCTVLVLFGSLLIGATINVLGGSRLDLWGIAILVVSVVATVFAVWWIVDLARGSIRRGAVFLTPVGVYHRGWAFEAFSTWAGISALRLDNTAGPSIRLVTDPVRALWAGQDMRQSIEQLRSGDVSDEIRQTYQLRDQAPNGSKWARTTSRLISAAEFDDGRDLVLATKWIAADPVLVLDLIRFYYENPAARAELGTEAAHKRAVARS
ncbi:MAG: hypothetical protein ACRDSE_05425 [Pseudonocardiaceae bacterium]